MSRACRHAPKITIIPIIAILSPQQWAAVGFSRLRKCHFF
jgi:hypothetical protein